MAAKARTDYSRLMNYTSLMVAASLGLAACAASPSDGYERHGMSRLVEVQGSASEFVFEVADPPAQPEEDAEATRMRWLGEWLAVKGRCPAGFEIVDRRQFGPFEYNPTDATLRYLVRCRAGTQETAQEN